MVLCAYVTENFSRAADYGDRMIDRILSGAQAGVADTPGGTPGHEHAAGTMPGSEVEFVGDGTGTYESVRMPSADNAAESCEDEAQGAQAAELAGLSV